MTSRGANSKDSASLVRIESTNRQMKGTEPQNRAASNLNNVDLSPGGNFDDHRGKRNQRRVLIGRNY